MCLLVRKERKVVQRRLKSRVVSEFCVISVMVQISDVSWLNKEPWHAEDVIPLGSSVLANTNEKLMASSLWAMPNFEKGQIKAHIQFFYSDFLNQVNLNVMKNILLVLLW